jgi:formylglycine-generating enzyme required for sulfatase activity
MIDCAKIEACQGLQGVNTISIQSVPSDGPLRSTTLHEPPLCFPAVDFSVPITTGSPRCPMRTLITIWIASCFVALQSRNKSGPAMGATVVNPKDGLTYVWIPPGAFVMGCSPGDNECWDDERPSHRLTITKGFWIGQTEVTQAAYQRVMASNPSQFKGASLPVESVSWDDGQAYCQAVGLRLPTEAEWEYAARGGNPAARYSALDAAAWYERNSGAMTHEVGQKAANGYGLYDMLGNVWEWVADWFDEKYYAASPASDPTGPSTGHYRTLRGGTWYDEAMSARASNRFRNRPDSHSYGIGVRCAGH